MGRVFAVTLEGKIYSCKHCGTHLAVSEDIISKRRSLKKHENWIGKGGSLSFYCKHGKAYLFDKVVNVTLGEKEERLMTTGMHVAADIFCVRCGSVVGWKYETAQEKSQKYKEGRSVLERFKISGPDGSSYWVGHEAHAGGSDADEAA